MDRREEIVRRMWEAYERRGLAAILDFAAPDAQWRPYSSGGRTFSSTREYRAFVGEMQQRGDVVDATLVDIELIGDDEVIVSGRLRVRREGALEDSSMYWRHRFRDDQIVLTVSSPRREDVLS